ncbi:SDR family oxidoreductase [Streptomyces sp. KM273126]|nr:SDR family oxidoreductase [Streptomyces sp. KM273126]
MTSPPSTGGVCRGCAPPRYPSPTTPTAPPIVPVDDFAVPRNATPDEIANFILFTASDQASFATGTKIIADGGFTLGALT